MSQPAAYPLGGIVKADQEGILVKTAKGCLAIEELQLEAGKRMTAQEFMRGHKLKPGDVFDGK